MKAVVVMNPSSGQGNPAETCRDIRRLLRKQGLDWRIRLTKKSGDAAELARKAVRDGCELVVAAGGDGTVNEVVNGIGDSGVTLGIIPLGTVNVLARELHIPLDYRKAIQVAAEGHIKRIDLGRANGRFFTLMAGFGFDAEVVANVVRPLKDVIGATAYVFKVLETLTKYDATDVTLEMPGETYHGQAFLVVVANSSDYAYRLKVTPYASPDDGLLDVIVFERPASNRVGFFRQLLEVFIRRHVYHRAVKYFKTTSVTVKSVPDVMVQLDGDAFGTTPTEVTVIPHVLPVTTPKD